MDQRLGDVDESGTIDAADALSVLQHSVQLISLEGENYLAGDVDGSGILDAVDALQISSAFGEANFFFPAMISVCVKRKSIDSGHICRLWRIWMNREGVVWIRP